LFVLVASPADFASINEGNLFTLDGSGLMTQSIGILTDDLRLPAGKDRRKVKLPGGIAEGIEDCGSRNAALRPISLRRKANEPIVVEVNGLLYVTFPQMWFVGID
jgi:hypothetical protein